MNSDFAKRFPGYLVAEQLGETHYSSVYRARKEGQEGTVVIKEVRAKNPSPDQISRFKHEYELIRSINIDGIIKPIDFIDCKDALALVLEDFGGVSLKHLLQNGFTLENFLKLSIRMAEILGTLHQGNITHRDIKPSNILWNPESDILKITDFGISEIVQVNDEISNPTVIEGTLAYISPEQTGRMNCGVDYRTDLYSLGVSFYEMLSGTVPFRSKDPMEIIHAHIAKLPVPPCKLDPEIPTPVSDIVMKLLSKSPAERYQNSLGLKADLAECLRRLNMTGRIEPFTLGAQDISLRFTIPQQLVGRDNDLNILLSAFDRVSCGAVEVILVTGEPGIGKSALVNELHKPIVAKRGYFLAGKFDQFHRVVPYSAIIQAFQGLIKQLLAESDEQLHMWKKQILSALGPNGRIITESIPEIEFIIGKQPDLPELGPEETQNRFNLVFKNFIRVFAGQSHPLVLFLDDLQWADSASLNLIETIATDQSQRFLMIVGAYRDTEVADHHPFMLTRDAIYTAEIPIDTIRLGALDCDDINRMIAALIRCVPSDSLAFATAIHAKTKGSPFFINQFLKTLYDSGHLCLDHSCGWTWNLKKIEALQATENVVQFMAEKLHELPVAILEIIQLCACIGNRFDLSTLVRISGKTVDEILSIVDSLLQEGLITRMGDLYRFYHDRIQEAAYSLLSQTERERIHLQIGRLYLQRTPAEQIPNRIFYICDQLNIAGPCISNRTERTRLAGLNLKAGVKAKESTAYAAAVSYLDMGCDLLPKNAWSAQYNLTYDLFTEQMECRYLTRNFDEAERLFSIIIANAATKLDKAKAYKVMIGLYTTLRTADEAIALGLEALKIFDINLKADVGVGPVIVELIKARYRLKKIGLKNIVDLPNMQDEELIVIHELMLNMGVPAFYANPNLFALTSLMGVNASLKHGLMQHSSVAFIAMANIVQTSLGDYEQAYRIGEMSLQLNDKLDNRRISGTVQHTFALLILHWKRHVKAALDIYPKAYELSMNSGNFIMASHSINAAAECRLILGHRLDDILEELGKYQDFMVRLKDPFLSNHYREIVQFIRALKGFTPVRHDMSEDDFDHSAHIQQLRREGNIFGLYLTLYSGMVLLAWYRKFKEAYQFGVELDKHIKVVQGTILVPYYCFNQSLILAGLLREGTLYRKRQYKTIIRRNLRKLRKWAEACPENFQHKHDLVAAELAVLNGRIHTAVKLYHAAVDGAHKNGFLSLEALSCERLGDFYLTNECKEEAAVFIRRAHRAYVSWGATAKEEDLKENYPDLFSSEESVESAEGRRGTTSSESTSIQLDLSTVMQVSQVISGEIKLDSLLAKTMHMSISNAGAQRGYLILESDGRLNVQASEDVYINEKKVLQDIPIEECRGLSPAIINYVYHSGEPIILGNAAGEGDFMDDPHIIEHSCKSILCMPIMNKGMHIGILYMENNLTTDAFTPERFEILRVISAQAAISIQNAQLYNNITTEIAVRKRAEEAMRTSEKKYRKILEEMQDVYCEMNLSGVITFVNPSACAVSGYTQSQLIGGNIGSNMTPEEQKNIESYFRGIYASGKPGKPTSCDFIRKNGETVSLEIVASPIRNKAGDITGFRSVGRDVSERKRLEHDLLESYKNVQTARMATILGLAKLAEYRDEETGSHLERMREYALVLVRELARKSEYQKYVTPEYIEDIYNSAILHDIGKVGVPDAILLKPGKLTREEFEIIKTHSTLGGDALREVEGKIEGKTFLTLSKEIAYYHHEKWDGSGYPKGLKGDKIPLSARIVALADVYDALTSKRVYKPAFSHQKAMDIIMKDRSTHFAPDVVDAFLIHAEEFRRIREELHDE